jgi:hypothetical protein
MLIDKLMKMCYNGLSNDGGDFMSDGYEVTLKAVLDEGVMGEGRLHYVFPHIPKDIGRALIPAITGGIWIIKGTPIPEKLIITLG